MGICGLRISYLYLYMATKLSVTFTKKNFFLYFRLYSTISYVQKYTCYSFTCNFPEKASDMFDYYYESWWGSRR